MLTTPKNGDALSGAKIEPLAIKAELRTHHVSEYVRPQIRISADVRPGHRKTMRKGVPAVYVVTERVTTWNRIAVDRQTIGRVLVQRARPGIVVQGPPRTVDEAMSLMKVTKLIGMVAMVATAYTAGSAQAFPTGRTATGLLARYGVVAVDPRIIPLGSHLFIPGYGNAIAADTGGAIVGHRIDLCMNSLSAALNFGRQTVRVFVLHQPR
ncbi:MAG: 3D domain-containing protein [Candidatus Eremiobacter antarcticus]